MMPVFLVLLYTTVMHVYIVSVIMEFDIIPSVHFRSSFSSHWLVSVQGGVNKITSSASNLDHSTK